MLHKDERYEHLCSILRCRKSCLTWKFKCNITVGNHPKSVAVGKKGLCQSSGKPAWIDRNTDLSRPTKLFWLLFFFNSFASTFFYWAILRLLFSTRKSAFLKHLTFSTATIFGTGASIALLSLQCRTQFNNKLVEQIAKHPDIPKVVSVFKWKIGYAFS